MAKENMLMTRSSVVMPQTPDGSSVERVIVTDPFVISFALGVYDVIALAALSKVPVPKLDQVEDVAVPPIVAEISTACPAQISWSTPASAVGTSTNVNVAISKLGLQGPIGSSVVRIKSTFPAIKSAVLGVYVAFNKFSSSNDPVPLEVQVPEVADPPTEPFKNMSSSEQTV